MNEREALAYVLNHPTGPFPREVLEAIPELFTETAWLLVVESETDEVEGGEGPGRRAEIGDEIDDEIGDRNPPPDWVERRCRPHKEEGRSPATNG
jgi:hypothetical protein